MLFLGWPGLCHQEGGYLVWVIRLRSIPHLEELVIRGRPRIAQWLVRASCVAVFGFVPAGLVAHSGESTPESAEAESGTEGEATADEGEEGDGSAENGSTQETSSEGEAAEAARGGDEEASEADADNGSAGDAARAPREYCDGYMRTHGESSARKLYRALNGNDYDVEQVGLGPALEAEVVDSEGTRSRVRFEVGTENEGQSAVLVPADRSYRRTLVVARTASGPVVTIHRWPERSNISSRSDCEPTQTRIAHPDVPADAVELEPFDYWGVRVLWRIPSEFSEGEGSKEMSDVIRDVLSKSEP